MNQFELLRASHRIAVATSLLRSSNNRLETRLSAMRKPSPAGRTRTGRVDLRLSETEERKLDALVELPCTMVEGSTKNDVLRALIGEAHQAKIERAPRAARRSG